MGAKELTHTKAPLTERSRVSSTVVSSLAPAASSGFVSLKREEGFLLLKPKSSLPHLPCMRGGPPRPTIEPRIVSQRHAFTLRTFS